MRRKSKYSGENPKENTKCWFVDLGRLSDSPHRQFCLLSRLRGKVQRRMHARSAAKNIRPPKRRASLNGEAWPQFYSRCTIEIKAGAVATEAAAPTLDIRQICSEKYQAAKAAGALEGATWPQFYSRCTSETKANPPAAEPASPAPEAVAVAPPVVAAPEPPVGSRLPRPSLLHLSRRPPSRPPLLLSPRPRPGSHARADGGRDTRTGARARRQSAQAGPVGEACCAGRACGPDDGSAVFPTAISPDFASEKPAKARLKTCSKQFQANKATNANGGLKWIQKGGGYWSECNKRLKG